MRFRDREVDIESPKIMGVLNVTPDSFSDGGSFVRIDAALRHGVEMFEEGADFIDVGGESTRPGALPVSETEELDRVIPVVERLARETDALISVDTSSPLVMTEAYHAGAHLINDVRALTRPGALKAAVALGLPVCLMHMQKDPQSMQQDPRYDSVVEDVHYWLSLRQQECVAEGLAADQIFLDPGFGFGKSLQHNLELLRALPRFSALGPLLIGVSRKTMIGQITGRPVDQRMVGSVVAALWAAQHSGVAILRVHDVAATQDALTVWKAINYI